MFEFSEDEVDSLWASVDANETGVITRPKAALLIKRAVILQHGKMEAMVMDKLAKEEAIEDGLIRGIPRWLQWCAAHVGRILLLNMRPTAVHSSLGFLEPPLLRRGIGDSVAILQEQIAMISVAMEKLE